MTVKEAINVILSDTKSHSTTLNWAIGYCKCALNMSGEELRVQCLYILNNITRWRHPKAKDVRSTLKEFANNG